MGNEIDTSETRATIDGRYDPVDFRGRPLEQVSDDDLAHVRGLYDGEIAWNDLHLGMLVESCTGWACW